MIPPTTPFHALVSYAYYAKHVGAIQGWSRSGMRFILDSGAFSAYSLGQTIGLDDYTTWVQQVGRENYDWAASLDVIGDPAGSWRNFRQLRQNGIDAVPTVHAGTGVGELDRYVDQGCDLIGLGGMARRKDHPAVLRWLVTMFRYARDTHPQVRFHGWGVTRRDYLLHLPFWSVDSSGFGSGYRYGTAVVFDDRTGVSTSLALNGSGGHAKAGRVLRELGVNPADIMRADPSNRVQLVGLSGHHAQAMERFYTRRHQVTPPASLVSHGPGTRFHWAEGSPSRFEEMDSMLGTRIHLADSDNDVMHKISNALNNARPLVETT